MTEESRSEIILKLFLLAMKAKRKKKFLKRERFEKDPKWNDPEITSPHEDSCKVSLNPPASGDGCDLVHSVESEGSVELDNWKMKRNILVGAINAEINHKLKRQSIRSTNDHDSNYHLRSRSEEVITNSFEPSTPDSLCDSLTVKGLSSDPNTLQLLILASSEELSDASKDNGMSQTTKNSREEASKSCLKRGNRYKENKTSPVHPTSPQNASDSDLCTPTKSPDLDPNPESSLTRRPEVLSWTSLTSPCSTCKSEVDSYLTPTDKMLATSDAHLSLLLQVKRKLQEEVGDDESFRKLMNGGEVSIADLFAFRMHQEALLKANDHSPAVNQVFQFLAQNRGLVEVYESLRNALLPLMTTVNKVIFICLCFTEFPHLSF